MSPQRKRGRLPATVLILFLAALGLLIVYAVSFPALRALSQLRWTRLSCEVLSAAYTEVNYSPALKVSYRYTFEGREFQSDQFRLPSNVSSSEEALRRTLDLLQPGNSVPCWIEPGNPENAVLEREGLGILLVLIFPLIFFVLAVVHFRYNGTDRPAKSEKQEKKPERERTPSSGPSLGVFIFFGIFILVGVGLTYLFFGHGFLKVRAAQQWTETICQITRSGVDAQTSKDSKGKSSTSYSFDVAYQYAIEGKALAGEVYSPFLGSTGYAEARALADALPVGSATPCFYNPANHFEVLISRDIPRRAWFGLLPLLFAAAGILGLIISLGVGQSKRRQVGRTGRMTRTAASRFGGLLTLLLVNLVWNGLVFGIGFALWQEMQRRIGALFPLLILTPFALIGALLLAAIPYAFLQLFNPSVDLDLSSDSPQPGQPFSLGWTLNGSPSRVHKLTIELEAFTTTHSGSKKKGGNEEKKFVIPVVSTDRRAQFERGRAQITVPSGEELASRLGPGRVKWRVVTKLSIPFYPDAGEIINLTE